MTPIRARVTRHPRDQGGVMISVYIAARWETKEGARKLRDLLSVHGIGCTSSWLNNDSEKNIPDTNAGRRVAGRLCDFDIRRSQALVLWNPAENAKSGSGGCHNETGKAQAWGIPVFVVGAPSNVFHFAEGVLHFDPVVYGPHLATKLAQAIRREVMDFEGVV